MIFCPKCHTQLVEGAKFCHHCGINIEIPLRDCPSCDKKNPADVAFCYACSQPMSPVKIIPYNDESKYDFEYSDVLEDQIRTAFFEELKRLAAWIAPDRVEDYLREFFFRNFTSVVAQRAEQLSDEYAELNYRQAYPSAAALEIPLDNAISSLALYHIIYNCRLINPFYLKEQMLNYDSLRTKINVRQMVFDFLDFANEKERVYADFIKMPHNMLENAAKHFVFASKEEIIYFISDQSLLGSGKHGFAMSEFAIYWKAPTEKPHKVYYHHLKEIKKHKAWITINGHFFSVSPSLNVKMLLLLEKLKVLYA